MKKVLSFALILLMFMVNHAISHTIQFRDYEWGTKISKIEKILKDKAPIIDYDDMEIYIHDKYLEGEARILFVFTPKTELLTGVKINFENGSPEFNELHEIFSRQYGPYKMQNGLTERVYTWEDSNNVLLLREKNNRITIYMYNKRLLKKMKEEREDVEGYLKIPF